MEEQSSDKAERAFYWIVGILQNRKIPFQISGGLAAKVYGSPRPLKDIDIEVSEGCLAEIAELVKPYITFGPAHIKDAGWDLDILEVAYKGQLIDIGGAEHVRICDIRDGIWKDSPADISTAEQHEIFGITVPVTEPVFLAAYKEMLKGDHQKVDVEAVRQFIDRRHQ
jgi:hypothetical protein